MAALPLQYGFETVGGGEVGGSTAEAENEDVGVEEGSAQGRGYGNTEKEEDERMVDLETPWPWISQADSGNPNLDGNEMDIFDSIHPETFVFDTDFRQWEWSMGSDV